MKSIEDILNLIDDIIKAAGKEDHISRSQAQKTKDESEEDLLI